VVVNRGPRFVQEKWLYGSWLWSVRGTRTDAVLLNRGPCVILNQWLYSCGFWSVSDTRAVNVW
jgi:hypothetical protein